MALQDSSESGDTDILSENEDVGTQIPYDKSRLGSTRSKQLPVPVSVREGESDDLEPLIATHDVSEWSCEEVRSWIVNIFNESIADKFTEQEISGTALLSHRVLSDDSMEKLGLNTIGKKEKFTSSVQKLQAHDERAPKNVCKLDRPKGKLNSGKLSLPDIKSLDPATKSIYLTVRTRICRAAEKEFPGDDIPTFRNNNDAKKRLDKLVNQLVETCSIKEVNFGEEGIRSHIMEVLNERRRMVTFGHSYQDKRKSSDSDSEASSPPCSQLKKKKAHNSHGDDTENSTSLHCTEDIISEEGSSTNSKSQMMY